MINKREIIGKIENKYIEEAGFYKGKSKKNLYAVLTVAAAIVLIIGVLVLYNNGLVDKENTRDSELNEESNDLTRYYNYLDEVTGDIYNGTQIVVSTGRITNEGDLERFALSLCLKGEDIECVRFSCQNQYITFTSPSCGFVDCSLERAHCGLECGQDYWRMNKNFTIYYDKEDEYSSENYVLTWNPSELLNLLEEESLNIADLSEEQRSDKIVMEIEFEDGTTECAVLNIRVEDDGQVGRLIEKYTVTDADEFVFREDGKSEQQLLEEELETAILCQEVVNSGSKILDYKQLSLIYESAMEYYDKIGYFVTDMTISEDDSTSESYYEQYDETNIVVIVVEGPGMDPARHIVVGTEDDWNTCEVLSEGY